MLYLQNVLFVFLCVITAANLGGAFAMSKNETFPTGYEKRKHSIRGGPNIFIIGAQKCGTTSLHHLFMSHPSFCPSVYKEIHYFDRIENWRKGAGFYLAHFKTSDTDCTLNKVNSKSTEAHINSSTKASFLDATPDYFTNLLAPARIFQSFSAKERAKKKFILILREPVSREYSWYNHRVRMCTTAMRDQLRRQKKNKANAVSNKLCADKHCKYLKCQENVHNAVLNKDTNILANFTEYYRSGGLVASKSEYMTHLTHWLKYFPRKQFFIINLSTLLTNTTDTVQRLTNFLDIPPFPESKMTDGKIVLPHENSARVHTTFDCAVRNELYQYYEQKNEALYEFMMHNTSSKSAFEPPFPPFVIQPCKAGQVF